MICSKSFSAAVSLLLASSGASAITVTPSQDGNGLASALLSGANTGIVVTSSTLSGHTAAISMSGTPIGTFTSSGTYTNPSNTYGIGSGVVLSTGGVQGVSFQGAEVLSGYGDGPNSTGSNGFPFGADFDVTNLPDPNDPPPGAPATDAQELFLDPITGDATTQTFYDHYDVTELVINFDMQAGFDRVGFKIVFGSEEFPEFVESSFIDGFGMFLNGVNIAQVGNTLRFIVADTSDGVLDTTVYFSALAGVPEVPLPPTLWLLGTAAIGLLGRSLAKRRQRAPDAT